MNYTLMDLEYKFLFYIYVCTYMNKSSSTLKNVDEILDCIIDKMIENSGQRIVEGDLRIDLNINGPLREETNILAELKYQQVAAL